MSNDEKQTTTTQLEAVPAWAVELSRNVVNIRGNVEILTGDMTSMKIDIRALQQFRIDVESAPRPVTSERAAAIVAASASKVSLEQDAKVGLLLAAKDEEIATLKANSATKEDIAKALDEVTEAQTKAILGAVDAFAAKPLVKKLTGAIVPVLMLAIAVIGLKLQASLARLQTAPQQQSTVVQIASSPPPVDAGVDR